MLNRLNKTWSDYLTAGVFKTLAAVYTLPWASDTDITPEKLDMQYHLNHSGLKYVSPAVSSMIESADPFTGILTAVDKTALAGVIWTLFHIKWSKLWATLNFDYNPIENYDRTEEKTGTETGTDTPTNWKETRTETPTNWTETKTETPTEWKETTEGASADNEAVTSREKWGFNSTDPVPDERATTTAKNKQTVERSGSYETETERTGSYETETERSGSFEHEVEYDTELHVHGNIGVTTSQQMIQSERELWMWDFFNQVFQDVDSVLTIDIY